MILFASKQRGVARRDEDEWKMLISFFCFLSFEGDDQRRWRVHTRDCFSFDLVFYLNVKEQSLIKSSLKRERNQLESTIVHSYRLTPFAHWMPRFPRHIQMTIAPIIISLALHIVAKHFLRFLQLFESFHCNEQCKAKERTDKRTYSLWDRRDSCRDDIEGPECDIQFVFAPSKQERLTETIWPVDRYIGKFVTAENCIIIFSRFVSVIVQ